MSTRNQALRNTLFSSVGIYTEYFLGMLTSIIIARHLGPADFGAYALVIWLVATGVVMTNSGSASAAIKFVAELRGAGRDQQIRPLLSWLRRVQATFLTVVVVTCVVLFTLFGHRLMPDMHHGVLLAILLGTTALRAAYMFNIGIAKGYQNFRVTAVVATVVTPINLALVLAAWWFDGPMTWFLGVFTVSSVVFWWVSRRQVGRLLPSDEVLVPLDPDLRRRALSYTLMVALSVTVGFITASEIEVLFLTLFDSAASAGHFKVAYQLASGAALLVPGVFASLLLPMMANAISQGAEVASRRLAMSTSYLALLAAPLVAFGVVYSDQIIGLLYGAAYAPAAPAFAVCLVAISISTLSQGASSYLLGSDRQKKLMIAVLAGAVVKVTLDVLLIRHFGLYGAVAAYATTAVLMASTLIFLALRASGARLQVGRLLRIVLAGALAAAAIWPVGQYLSPFPTLLAGGMVLVVVYALATLALGCWSRSDIDQLAQLHQRFARGRLAPVTHLLAWAGRRSERAGL